MDLREALLKEFGSAEGLARLIHEEVMATKPGSPQRVSLLRNVLQILAKTEEDEEELRPEDMERLEQLLKHAKSRRKHETSKTAGSSSKESGS